MATEAPENPQPVKALAGFLDDLKAQLKWLSRATRTPNLNSELRLKWNGQESNSSNNDNNNNNNNNADCEKRSNSRAKSD